MSTFCQRSYHRKCQRRGVGGKKKPKSCQRSQGLLDLDGRNSQKYLHQT